MMINPVVFAIGGVQLHAFTAAIVLSVALGLASILWRARQLQQPLMHWIDCAIGAVIGGIVGARALHVILAAGYFSAHTDQIWSLTSGGLDWHGAIFGGVMGLALVAWLSRVRLADLTDAIALVFPLAAALVWAGSGSAASAYGLEVGTLADYPGWLVTESPDVYGAIAPRLDLPHLAIAISLTLWALIIILHLAHRGSGLRLWLTAGLLSLIMAFMSFFRGDVTVYWAGHRADQVLDLAVLLLVTLLAALTVLKRDRHRAETNGSIDQERTHYLGHVSKIDHEIEENG
jgi:phosphatidylglycerol:prolipoprotein diacylglycerol transferase